MSHPALYTGTACRRAPQMQEATSRSSESGRFEVGPFGPEAEGLVCASRDALPGRPKWRTGSRALGHFNRSTAVASLPSGSSKAQMLRPCRHSWDERRCAVRVASPRHTSLRAEFSACLLVIEMAVLTSWKHVMHRQAAGCKGHSRSSPQILQGLTQTEVATDQRQSVGTHSSPQDWRGLRK